MVLDSEPAWCGAIAIPTASKHNSVFRLDTVTADQYAVQWTVHYRWQVPDQPPAAAVDLSTAGANRPDVVGCLCTVVNLADRRIRPRTSQHAAHTRLGGRLLTVRAPTNGRTENGPTGAVLASARDLYNLFIYI